MHAQGTGGSRSYVPQAGRRSMRPSATGPSAAAAAAAVAAVGPQGGAGGGGAAAPQRLARNNSFDTVSELEYA